jgi:hypothetical protein
MNTMPNVIDVDWTANENEKAKEMVNFGIGLAAERVKASAQFNRNYNAYHGEYTQEELTKMTTKYGHVSQTPYKSMKLGKVKLDRLIGEAIELNFQAEVTTTNRDAILKKAKQIARAKGRSLMKPFIEQQQQQGHDIFSGVKIPDYGDPTAWDPKNFRTNNERIMDILLKRKLKDPEADYIYSMLFISGCFTSEIHSLVVDRGAKNYFPQVIPSEQMIFMDTGLDNQTGKSPIIGHKEKMTFGDVVKRFNLDVYGNDYKKVKEYFQTGTSADAQGGGTTTKSGPYSWVYFFQWRIYKTKWFKVQEITEGEDQGKTRIDDITDQYNSDEKFREQTDADNESKKYNVQRAIVESIYEGASVDGVVFLGFGEAQNQIKLRDYKNRYNVSYDYTTTLIKTIGNKRTAYANVMLDLNEEYDHTWWLIRKNLKKLKVVPIVIDQAALGGKTLDLLFNEMEENDVIIIDSSHESLNTEFDDARKVVGSLNGQSNAQSIVQALLTVANDIERAMDLLTGINDARQGIEKATTTATTNQSNLKASRSVTYDLFYFAQKHEEVAMTKVLNKEKLAVALNPEDYQFLDEFDNAFIKATVEIAMDDYSARVTDGKREHDLKNDIDLYLPQEVNARRISTADVIDFKISDSFSEAVKILRDAVQRSEQLEKQMADSKNQTVLQNTQQQTQAMTQNREDEQAHDMEKTMYVENNKRYLENLKLQAKAAADTNKNITAIFTSAQKASEANKKKPS